MSAFEHKDHFHKDLLNNENAWALTHPPASCPLRCLRLSSVTPWCHAMITCDVVTWRHSRYARSNLAKSTGATGHPISEFLKKKNHVFQPDDLDLWPMTLVIKLGLDIIQIHPCDKFGVFTSNGSVVKVAEQQTQTYRHWHRRNRFYTLDHWRGREWECRCWRTLPSCNAKPF